MSADSDDLTHEVTRESFTLADDDVIRVSIDGVGMLENPVRTVGTDLRTASEEATP